MLNTALEQVKQSVLRDLNRTIELAKKVNLVVEIKLEPKQPLAMGNYDMVPSVREALESQFQFLTEKDVYEIGDCLKTLKRPAGFIPWINNTYLLCEKINNSSVPIGVVSEEVYSKIVIKPTNESVDNVDSNDKPDGG